MRSWAMRSRFCDMLIMLMRLAGFEARRLCRERFKLHEYFVRGGECGLDGFCLCEGGKVVQI